MNNSDHYLLIFLIIFVTGCNSKIQDKKISAFAEMAGEPTQKSVILKTRLIMSDSLVNGNVNGREGYVRFEIDDTADFSSSWKTGWIKAGSSSDYSVKKYIDDLEPGQQYFYRSIVGVDTTTSFVEESHRFKTLPAIDQGTALGFVVGSCWHYERFMLGGNLDSTINDNMRNTPAQSVDRNLGFPALARIQELDPYFYVANGDNVYYDHPFETRATATPEMRNKWHQLFSLPRVHDLLGTTPVYWLKDDHDYRYNDADTTNADERYKGMPSHKSGMEIFREQVPVTKPDNKQAKTYRTHRINKFLQIWMVEGRDYRSPNRMEDGPKKSIWGSKQKQWLKRTLKDSDALFKILISPTPMIGPDDAYKRDNHTNPGGFRYERNTFFDWLSENGFDGNNFFIITGDRHWQYHSIHPSGFEEFSSGALVDQNSRPGRKPGDPESTDPEGIIQQPYLQPEPSGGFLLVRLNGGQKELSFQFYDDEGKLLYEEFKTAD